MSENKDMARIPLIVHENEQMRIERREKRLHLLIGFLAALLVLTNAAHFNIF